MSDTPITEGMMERAAQHLLSKPQTTVEGAVITFMEVVTDEVIALERRLKAAEAENAALREDAERYRWLRKFEVDSFFASGKAKRLDVAIDKARNE